MYASKCETDVDSSITQSSVFHIYFTDKNFSIIYRSEIFGRSCAF